MDERQRQLETTHLEYWLREILTLPTAPFHEDAVSARVERFAEERGLGLRRDRAGNLVVEYKNPGRNTAPVAFTSHMDHPGFEVVESRGRQARLRLLGGVDEPTLRNSRIRIYSDARESGARNTGARGGSARGVTHVDSVRGGSARGGSTHGGGIVRVTKAEIRSIKMAKDRRKEHTYLRVACAEPVAVGDWGQFDLPRLSLAGGRIRSVALDNTCSVALILALLDRLCASRRRAHVYGVFTVAEEVGFVGALELVRSGILPRRVPLVVMETSRELPSFEIGKGPVIRVGDRLSVYDDHLTRWLSDSAETLAKRDKRFRFQRALMPGGMCEATLFQLEGWRACALALALDNYHNMGRRGAAAEAVSRSDAENLLLLMNRLAACGPVTRGADRLRATLERQYRRYLHRWQ